MSDQRDPWCWICEDVAGCDMCERDEPGQLGLFDAEVLMVTRSVIQNQDQ